MSWNARRFKSYDFHHVPPRHPAQSTPIKIRVRKIDHRAYHQLFFNAANLEQCIEILRRDWWPNTNLVKEGNMKLDELTAGQSIFHEGIPFRLPSRELRDRRHDVLPILQGFDQAK